jgi:putative transport protein
MELFYSPYFSLFLIIILGYALGAIKIKGINLGISAILFVSMVFGYYGLHISNDYKQIGLVLFIFTIGYQAGPSFFETFKKDGKNLLLLTLTIVISGVLVSVVCALIFGFSGNLTGGLFTGALTSTPGLAAVLEMSTDNSATIAYGIAYPFGVIGVVLFIKLLPKIFNMDIKKSEENYSAGMNIKYPKIYSRNFIVEHPDICGKKIKDLELEALACVNISRVLQNNVAFTPNSDTILEKGSIVRVAGTEKSLQEIENIIGRSTEIRISLSSDYDAKFLVVTNKKVLNKTIPELNLQQKYNVVITRITRTGLEFSAASNIKLQFGDKIKVVGTKEDIAKLSKLMGDEINKVYEANYIPIALGIVLGILLGQLKIKIGNIDISLGITGGVIVIAIIMSRIRKIGPMVFSFTGGANNVLRQIGLILFLSAVGTEAGSNLISTLRSNGINLLLSGVAITLIPMIISTIVAKYFLKIDVLQLLGGIAGGMTSTPGLAVADTMTNTNSPSVAYATIYPIALILVMISVQIIYFVL